jgi:hypothetical protein
LSTRVIKSSNTRIKEGLSILLGALSDLLKQFIKFYSFCLQRGLGGWVSFAKNLLIGLFSIEVYCFVCVLATYRLPLSIDIIAEGFPVSKFCSLSLISIKYIVIETRLYNFGAFSASI